MDDEWHAVHKLLTSTPIEIASSFGHADYSIPLTLLYWLESKIFGLSELMMRWPLMLFGVATLIIFPLYIKKHFNFLIVSCFAFLIAISPILIEYSRIARPYAMTLFLVYFSIIFFYKFYNDKHKNLKIGFLYVLSAALAIWLHLIVIMFIAAPFVVEFIKTLVSKTTDKKKCLLKLFKLGLPTLLIVSLLIIPPLINDMAAITSKVGNNSPNLDTTTAFLYLCFGTRSSMLVIIMSCLSIIGLYSLLKVSNLSVNILVGFGLTLLAIFIVQPAWVHIPITFTRYVLPIIPLVLLSTVIGLFNILNLTSKIINHKIIHRNFTAVILLFFIYNFTIHSPLSELLKKPNSNTLHSMYAIDFRYGENIIEDILKSRSVSPFWMTLKDYPISDKIAVAPWFFESYNWDGPIWEKTSQHYIIPGMLINLCNDNRKGEIPNNSQFIFKNLAYLADKNDLISKNIHWIVYQKPIRFNTEVNNKNLEKCQQSIQHLYGKPYYEDTLIAVYKPIFNDI